MGCLYVLKLYTFMLSFKPLIVSKLLNIERACPRASLASKVPIFGVFRDGMLIPKEIDTSIDEEGHSRFSTSSSRGWYV